MSTWSRSPVTPSATPPGSASRRRPGPRTKSGGLGSGAAQTGEPAVRNVTAPPGGQGAGTAKSGEPLGVFHEAHANPDGSITQATAIGGYEQKMAAQRDTFFIPGPETKPHHRFGGDLRAQAVADQDLLRALAPGQHGRAGLAAPRCLGAAGLRQHPPRDARRDRAAQGADPGPARPDPPRDRARWPARRHRRRGGDVTPPRSWARR